MQSNSPIIHAFKRLPSAYYTATPALLLLLRLLSYYHPSMPCMYAREFPDFWVHLVPFGGNGIENLGVIWLVVLMNQAKIGKVKI